MPRDVIRFPAYRDFELSRVEANDALMSLLLGRHLALRELDNNQARPGLLLGELYEGIPASARFNVPLQDARQALIDAEQHFAQMAIPSIVTVHEIFVREVVALLKAAGKDPPSRTSDPKRVEDAESIKLFALHDYVGACVGHGQLNTPEMRLFRWLRLMRNGIAHAAGFDHRGVARRLQKHQDKAVWEGLSTRPFLLAADGRFRLGEGEVIATLAICDRLAQQVNRLLRPPSIDAAWWADTIVRDYRTTHPQHYRNVGSRVRRVQGFARQYYSAARVSRAEVAQAVERATR